MSAFKQAFDAAGYKSDEERLCDIAVDILTRYPDWRSSRAHEALFAAVIKDPGLLWALFASYRTSAAHKLLFETMHDVRQHEIERQYRKPDGLRPVAVPSGSGQGYHETHPASARPADQFHQKPAVQPRNIRNTLDVISKLATKTLLDTFMIEVKAKNGSVSMKLGDCRPSEARGWARAQSRDVRFVELLTKDLSDAKLIREQLSPEKAAKIRAEADSYAA
jgi:hypothetical protein